MVYFNVEHFLPFERLTRVCQDLYGQPLSEATIVAANQCAYDHLAPFERRLVQLLPQAPLNNCDETGLRVAQSLHWLHVVSNPSLTFYGVHAKRGKEAMDEFGILPQCKNWLIHDHWKAYFTYDQCRHALCNEHHLRELKFLAEEHHEAWAQQMSDFLLDCLEQRKSQGLLDERQFKQIRTGYRAILKKARLLHPRKAGRGTQSKAANLLDRLEDFEWNVLAFTVFEEVPFTNNGAERDLRMEKTKQKFSGCFRTLHGARVFARVRSYISTCRKRGRNILEELQRAIAGRPYVPVGLLAGP
jgi:transposase